MAARLLALLLAAAGSQLDEIAPEGKGFATQGDGAFVVVRPLAAKPGAFKLLVSDAQSDAPLTGEVEVECFGPAGQPAARGKATAGTLPGHYFVDLGPPGAGRQSLVVRVAVAGRPAEVLAVDGISPVTTTTGMAPVRPAPPNPAPAVVGLLLSALVLFARRRGRRTSVALLVVALAVWVFPSGDARAHGPLGDVAPEPPGSRLYLAQETQFALGLRTSPVELKSFAPSDPGLAARQYPAIRREAIVERDGKKLVVVRVAPEYFVAREVSLGWTAGEWCAVESGVNPGEKVVIEGAAFLRNGGAVAP
jgi:hypothetical protein